MAPWVISQSELWGSDAEEKGQGSLLIIMFGHFIASYLEKGPVASMVNISIYQLIFSGRGLGRNCWGVVPRIFFPIF
jgi:hypothetical protein